MGLYLREHLTYDQARMEVLHEGKEGKDLYMKGSASRAASRMPIRESIQSLRSRKL